MTRKSEKWFEELRWQLFDRRSSIKVIIAKVLAKLDLLNMVENAHDIFQWIFHLERLLEVLGKLEEIFKVLGSVSRIFVHQNIRKIEVEVQLTIFMLGRVKRVVRIV